MMKFFQTLQKSIGNIIRLKTQLYWFQKGVWDNNPGRVCLILDVLKHGGPASACTVTSYNTSNNEELVLLLINGLPVHVWTSEPDIEFIDVE
jgi:hypothetical protein